MSFKPDKNDLFLPDDKKINLTSKNLVFFQKQILVPDHTDTRAVIHTTQRLGTCVTGALMFIQNVLFGMAHTK